MDVWESHGFSTVPSVENPSLINRNHTVEQKLLNQMTYQAKKGPLSFFLGISQVLCDLGEQFLSSAYVMSLV